MNPRRRQIVALVLVSAALCADRAVAATPAMQTVSASAASLVDRFAQKLGSAVRQVRLPQQRRDDDRAVVQAHPLPALGVDRHVQQLPARFRLPPPIA